MSPTPADPCADVRNRARLSRTGRIGGHHMTVRHVTAALAAAGLVAVMAAPASAVTPAHGGNRPGVQSVTAITNIYTFGQKVAAVAIGYPDDVNPRTLDRRTFTVSDS